MKNHCFYFLKDSYEDICNEAMFCEKHLINDNFIDSIIRAGKASEIITRYICEFENQDHIMTSSQDYKLGYLVDYEYIPSDIYDKLTYIRKIRNNAIHDHVSNLKETAYKVHAYLYYVSAYFFKNYRDSNCIIDEYNGPIMKITSKPYENKDNDIERTHVNNDNDYKKDYSINSSYKNYDSEDKDCLLKINPEKENTLNTVQSTSLGNYPFEKYNDSYLLNELSKLKNSSIEAVEDDELSEFKEYLHVHREIQDDFIKALNKANESDNSHLIMLCGSVGDGKSHLIGNLKKKNPQLFSEFSIHNDATESFDPEKNAIDTLASVLKPFNDNNIDNSNDKLILAINLGVLNNFLESHYVNEEYNKLKLLIDKADIFESDDISDHIYGEKVSFITFSDYNMFELNDDENSNYTSSKYISSLFNKIIQKDNLNPFYVAYLKDKEANYDSPIIRNYEMLMNSEVQKVIIDYLIKIFIKYRKIIPTRDLLNFIYEIIVPPEYTNNRENNNIDNLVNSLPNLLFDSAERSDLLKLCNELDPTLYRNKQLDKFIIDLNINDDTERILNRYFDFEKFDFLEKYKKDLVEFKELNTEDKEKTTNVLIRFIIFYGKKLIKDNLKDKVYLKYLKYLYFYNAQIHEGYMNLIDEIKKAIYNWKGTYKKNTICIDILDSFRIYKNFKLNSYPDKFETLLKDNYQNRFKTDIKINFHTDSNDEKIPLNVDFSIYEYIIKLYNGFKPNQTNKEDLVILNEFINNLIENDSDKDLYIVSADSDKKFVFEYNDFGIYEFKED